MGPGTAASDGLPGPQRPQAAVDAGRGPNQNPEAQTPAGRTATSLVASLLGWASVGATAPIPRPGSAVPGERPRGRGFGRCGASSSLRGQPGRGKAALRQRREPHGATQEGLRVGGHRRSSVVREAYSSHWGKMGQLTNVSPQPTRLRGNLRAHGGGAERAGGSPGACSVYYLKVASLRATNLLYRVQHYMTETVLCSSKLSQEGRTKGVSVLNLTVQNFTVREGSEKSSSRE